MTEREAYDELCAYTLTHGDAGFIHQHVVDAFAAQHAKPDSKPIGITFALAGLYLHVEKHLTGRAVQRAHMRMARQKRDWPRFALPDKRGDITPLRVLATAEGPDRDEAIHEWCTSVWAAFAPANRNTVVELLREYNLA
jgi:hypothetical protein